MEANNQRSISGETFSAEDKAKEQKENMPRSFVIHTKDRLKPKGGRGGGGQD